MPIGLIGRKCGMTRIFTDEGKSIPVTVIEVEPNRITQVKSLERDGYRAIQVTTGQKKSSKVNSAMAGHYAKAATMAGRGLWEFRLSENEGADLKAGSEIRVDRFNEGQFVDIKSKTIGKGFAGGIKRYGFRSQDATHGNSVSHRKQGSIGQCQFPGRVFKGKRMPGHMGAQYATMQNLRIVRIDSERNLILVQGSVPGAKGSDVLVKPTTRKQGG